MALTSTEESLIRELIAQQSAILSLANNEATIQSKLGATKVTLSDLSAASALGASDLMLTRQGTTDKSVTASVLATFAGQDAVKLTGDQTIAGFKTFSSTPIAPTAPASDNTTKLATTGWVWTNIQALVASCIAAVATAAGFAVSLNANGYIRFPSWLGGLIIQWGSCSPGASATFPIAFPAAVRSIAFSNNSAGYISYSTRSTTGFACVGASSGASDYIAIGH